MNKYSKYVDYYKNIAAQHPSILHVDKTNHRFFKMNIDEVMTGFRTKVAEKGYILVLINYSYKTVDTSAHNLMKEINFGFVILKHHTVGDHNAYFEAMVGCENIVDVILARIKHESENLDPTEDNFYNSLSNLNNIYVSPSTCQGDINYSGYMVTGEMSVPMSCKVDPADWNDLTAADIDNAGNWGT